MTHKDYNNLGFIIKPQEHNKSKKEHLYRSTWYCPRGISQEQKGRNLRVLWYIIFANYVQWKFTCLLHYYFLFKGVRIRNDLISQHSNHHVLKRRKGIIWQEIYYKLVRLYCYMNMYILVVKLGKTKTMGHWGYKFNSWGGSFLLIRDYCELEMNNLCCIYFSCQLIYPFVQKLSFLLVYIDMYNNTVDRLA